MKFKEGNIPLYFQFYLKLKNDIMLGEIKPGTRVPIIEELHNCYKVSHATVRRALALLEKEGLIFKKRGLGTIVCDKADLAIWNPTSFRGLGKSVLKDAKSQILFCGWVNPPRRIARYYGDQPNSYRNGSIFKVHRLWAYLQNPRRKWVEEVYFSANVVSQFGEKKLCQSTFLESEIKQHIYISVKIHQTLRPWICDAEIAELLGIPDGTPVFHRIWVFHSPQDEVLVVSESITTANSLVRAFEAEIPAEVPD